MDAGREALLEELHREGVDFDAAKEDRRERRRNLEPDSAALLHLLVGATDARALLELGTSNGYSTIWLADALAADGGRMVSVDLDPGRMEEARANVARAGLAEVAELRLEDAAAALAATADSSQDFVFLDAERPAYPSYWPELLRVLRPGGLLAVDNVISHAEQVTEFRALVDAAAADGRVEQALAPTGAGLLLITRIA